MLSALVFPIIDPVAVSLGPLQVRWYALAYIVGLVLGWRYMVLLARQSKLLPKTGVISPLQIDDLLFYATLGVLLGGRLGYVLFYDFAYYAQNPLQALMIWRGGMAFHGGFLGIVLSVWWFARKQGLNVLTLGDMVAAAAPIGLFFGRLANFINGELFGRVSDVPWAMVFPNGGDLPRHPSQLYQAGLEGLVLFVILTTAIFGFKALHRRGLVMGLFLCFYGLFRVAVEFVRQPDAQLGLLAGGISMGQLLSIPMILAGFVLIIWARRQPHVA